MMVPDSFFVRRIFSFRGLFSFRGAAIYRDPTLACEPIVDQHSHYIYMHFDYTPTGVCSRHIEFDIDSEGRLHNVRFTGGCHGNTQGIGALTEGMDAREAAKRMGGIDCKAKGTSCPDQLARAITEALS